MSDPLRVQISGPLSVFAAGFLGELLERGYRPGTAAKLLQLMAHLSRWMAVRDLEPRDLRRVEIERFVHQRRASGRVQLASARALVPLLWYLRGLGVVPAAESREAPTPASELLDRYAEYLLVRRGLAGETVRGYCNTARAFLADHEPMTGDLALRGLDVAALNNYLLGRSRRGSIASSKAVVTGLRSLLSFLYLEGLIDRDLAVAVAPVANWRLASLVKALDASSVARLLDSCDRGTAVGRRDFAILLLLSRLGLRIGEVATLRLDDLDWRAGELVVCGKGSRSCRPPLPWIRISPARQSMSSSRRRATSPARSPRRASSLRIAKSRRPTSVSSRQLANRRFTSPCSSGCGSPASRQCATLGTARVNGSSSTPSTWRNRSSERSAVTVSFTDPRERRGRSARTNATISPAARDSRRSSVPTTRRSTNGLTRQT
jgi:integrase/recombinase XerD